MITIGPNDYDDIKIAELSNVIMIKNYAEIGQTGYVQFVHNDDSKLYINYELSNDKWSRAYIGDHVFINGIWFEVQSDGLKMMSHETMISDLIRLNQDTPDAQSDDYNDYHRSPRIIHREPTETIKIENRHNQFKRIILRYGVPSFRHCNDCIDSSHLFSQTNWCLYYYDDWYEHRNGYLWYYNLLL